MKTTVTSVLLRLLVLVILPGLLTTGPMSLPVWADDPTGATEDLVTPVDNPMQSFIDLGVSSQPEEEHHGGNPVVEDETVIEYDPVIPQPPTAPDPPAPVTPPTVRVPLPSAPGGSGTARPPEPKPDEIVRINEKSTEIRQSVIKRIVVRKDGKKKVYTYTLNRKFVELLKRVRTNAGLSNETRVVSSDMQGNLDKMKKKLKKLRPYIVKRTKKTRDDQIVSTSDKVLVNGILISSADTSTAQTLNTKKLKKNKDGKKVRKTVREGQKVTATRNMLSDGTTRRTDESLSEEYDRLKKVRRRNGDDVKKTRKRDGSNLQSIRTTIESDSMRSINEQTSADRSRDRLRKVKKDGKTVKRVRKKTNSSSVSSRNIEERGGKTVNESRSDSRRDDKKVSKKLIKSGRTIKKTVNKSTTSGSSSSGKQTASGWVTSSSVSPPQTTKSVKRTSNPRPAPKPPTVKKITKSGGNKGRKKK